MAISQYAQVYRAYSLFQVSYATLDKTLRFNLNDLRIKHLICVLRFTQILGVG
jgi:hypothetical protein